MRARITAVLWLAGPAAAACAATGDLGTPGALGLVFDGASNPAGTSLQQLLRPSYTIPLPAGYRVIRVAPDLEQAASQWGNEAQFAKLLRNNPLPKASFTVAVIGDSEPGRFPWQRIFPPADDTYERALRTIHTLNPDLIVHLGDFVSVGDEAHYRNYLELLQREVRVPILSVIGNHDRSSPNGAADKVLYAKVFGNLDFYYDFGGYRLIGLDSSDRLLTQAQLAWLGNALKTNLRKVIFTHIPPAFLKGRLLESGPALAYAGDVSGNSYLSDFLTGFFKEGSEEFGNLASQHSVERVYVGHIHAFSEADHGGVRYVLTAGGGSPLYPLPPGFPKRRMAHFVQSTFGPAGVSETVHPLEDE